MAFGFVVNSAFILPGLFAPRWLETLIEVGVTNTLHWLQNVSLLLLIVTLAYIPVYRDPLRYELVTYLIVGGRFAAGSLFLLGVLFMDYPGGMGTLASTDLVLSSLQAFLVYRMLQDGDPRAA